MSKIILKGVWKDVWFVSEFLKSSLLSVCFSLCLPRYQMPVPVQGNAVNTLGLYEFACNAISRVVPLVWPLFYEQKCLAHQELDDKQLAGQPAARNAVWVVLSSIAAYSFCETQILSCSTNMLVQIGLRVVKISVDKNNVSSLCRLISFTDKTWYPWRNTFL